METSVFLDPVTFALYLLFFKALFDVRIWRDDCSHLNYLSILSDKPFFSIANTVLVLEDLLSKYFVYRDFNLIGSFTNKLQDRDRILMDWTSLLLVELYLLFQCLISPLW